MEWNSEHILRIAAENHTPTGPEADPGRWRRLIEPWLSAVFQAEHLSLLLGNGFTTALAGLAGVAAVSMSSTTFNAPNAEQVREHARQMAATMGRGSANIEDELSAALGLLTGLRILGDGASATWETAINDVMGGFIREVLRVEAGIRAALAKSSGGSERGLDETLVSFLMSFASRAASRDRLHIFTTNYDRVIEKGCDLAGLRLVDRFVGSLEPEFRSSRLEVDLHFMSPGVRGEPRHLEGVVHLTKLHGSVDWRYERPRLYRGSLPFGAASTHPGVPATPQDSVMIYPNAVKDIETAAYPYAELFRDFSASLCRPNHVLVTYGYGFGDDHVNRIISDMLTIPSTHLAAIAWSEKPHERIASFLQRTGHPQQVSLLIGKHFGDIGQLVEHYLPKPAIDPLTQRMTELVQRRGGMQPQNPQSEEQEPDDNDGNPC